MLDRVCLHLNVHACMRMYVFIGNGCAGLHTCLKIFMHISDITHTIASPKKITYWGDKELDERSAVISDVNNIMKTHCSRKDYLPKRQMLYAEL